VVFIVAGNPQINIVHREMREDGRTLIQYAERVPPSCSPAGYVYLTLITTTWQPWRGLEGNGLNGMNTQGAPSSFSFSFRFEANTFI